MIHITYQGNIESKQFRQCWCQEIMDYTSGPYYEITWRVAWRVFSWCSSAAASFCFHFGSTISSPFRRSILSGSATNFKRMTQTYTEFLSVYNGFRSMQIKIFSKNIPQSLLQTPTDCEGTPCKFLLPNSQNLNRSRSRKSLPAEEATIAICNLWEDFKSPWLILQTSSFLQFIHTPSIKTSQALSPEEDRDTSSL